MISLLKILIVFAGIVILLSRKWNLGLVLLIASVGIGLLFSYPLPSIGRDMLLTAIAPLTLQSKQMGSFSRCNALPVIV